MRLEEPPWNGLLVTCQTVLNIPVSTIPNPPVN